MDKSGNGVDMVEYESVPTTDGSEKKLTRPPNKYTVNKGGGGGKKGVHISKPVLLLAMAGVLLLLIGAVLVTFFMVPRCDGSTGALKASAVLQQLQPASKELPQSDMTSDWDERLPKALKPSHYRVQIMPFIWPGNFTTHGEVTITLNSTQDTEEIVLHMNDLLIDEPSVVVREVHYDSSEVGTGTYMNIPVKEFMYETEKQRLTMVMERRLAAGNQYDVHMKFVGHLNDLLQGFYRISYYDYAARAERWMAATQFSPTDARRAFPCFDEPAMKARFTISLGRNSTMTSLSNMPLKETLPAQEMKGWVWDHYETTPIMSTYLVAMIVSELKPFMYESSNTSHHAHGAQTSNSSRSSDGENEKKEDGPAPEQLRQHRQQPTQFSVWSRYETLPQTRYAGLIGPRVLNYFENYFKIKFPLAKIDVVALPDFGFNAMENWGLITFREAALLYDAGSSSAESKRRIATVLSHELGHQWFGNLVTPEWWDDLWLKEGFATYVEYLGVDHVQPTWHALEEIVYAEHQASFELDCLRASHPIHVPVNRTEQIRQIFDSISYAKGASIIRMVNNFLGEYTFKVGLVNYLNDKKYSNAYHDDLWRSLTEQAHIDGTLDKNVSLKQIMDTWILQPGYPVVNVTRDYANKSAMLTQHRFLLTGESDDRSLWWVPISYTTGKESNFGNTTPRVWMENEEMIELTNLTEKNDWIYVNIKESGYYRVNYDVHNWILLLNDFQRLPSLVRAQLMDDAMNLARAGLLTYEVPLNMLIEMFRDPDQRYVPLAATLDGLEHLHNMLSMHAAYGKLKQFLSLVMDRVLKTVGFAEQADDPYDLQMKRPVVLQWSCRLDSTDCVIQSRHLFRKWMSQDENEPNPISPNLKKVVYCTAIREGAEVEWNFAYQQYLKTNLATERALILQALGCASEPWLLSRYLRMILKTDNVYSQIRKQDGSAVFQSVAKNIAGYNLAFDFLRMNWKELNNYYGLAFSVISKMVSAVPTYMNTEYQLLELIKFRDEVKDDLGTSERAFDQAIEKVHANVQWMNESYQKVEDWLDNMMRKYRLGK